VLFISLLSFENVFVHVDCTVTGMFLFLYHMCVYWHCICIFLKDWYFIR